MRLCHVLVLFAVLLPCVEGNHGLRTDDTNADVLRIARSIPDGGGYNTAFTGSGTPVEIQFQGQKILSQAVGGTYCSGFTFTVVTEAAASRGVLNGKTVAEIKAFQKQWYGVTKGSEEQQCVVAVEALGIGSSVAHDDARPGDFVQFWRKGSGHSVVLLEWITSGDQRVGLKYRSSQGKTKGVGDHVEYFSDAIGQTGSVDRKRTYICRLKPASAP